MTLQQATEALLEACKQQNAEDNKTLPAKHPRCIFTWQLAHYLGFVLLRLDELKLGDKP